MNRRKFLRKSSLGMGAYASLPVLQLTGKTKLLEEIKHFPVTGDVGSDEDFWALIRQAYTVSPAMINLNNAGVSPQPERVQQSQIKYLQWANETPTYYMWRVLNRNREIIRKGLAQIAGASPEEIAINRNATEALDTIIFGLTLQKGDEVVLSRQDYPNMVQAWKQRAMRDGIVLKWVDLPLPSEDNEALARAYTDLFSVRTKVVHLTHMLNWTGQIIPVEQISQQARRQGIAVVVDAAHSFAQLDVKLADIGADYAGVSLHKWLGAPFGTGMLYVRKPLIAELWPLFPGEDPKSTDVRKFEHLGTRAYSAEIAIGQAIEFHHLIGSARKAARLRYLRTYWLEKALQIPGFQTHSPIDPNFGGAIVNCNMEGIDPQDLSREMGRAMIHNSPVQLAGVEGVRLTPNVYTLPGELDRLLDFLQSVKS